MKRTLAIVMTTLMAVTFGSMWLSADPPATPIAQSPKVLMTAKLQSSQNVLAGLLREDFTLIAKGAREMKRISEAAEWPRARDSVYEHYSAEFRRQCSKLEDLAKHRNHEGASFTYLHMTTVCINCHDYVRDSLRVAGPGLRKDVQLIPSHWPEQNLGKRR